MHNFRSFIQALEDKGELVRISKEVDPKFEIAALMVKLEAEHKAFIFDNVKGAKLPLVGGLFSGLDRFALAHNIPEDQRFTRQDHGSSAWTAASSTGSRSKRTSSSKVGR